MARIGLFQGASSSNLKVGPEGHKYQTEGILGYPVLRALGRITFSSDGYFDAGPSKTPTASGARMYMDDLTPVIECSVSGQKLPFYLHWRIGHQSFSGLLQTIPQQREGLDERTSSYLWRWGVVPRGVSIQPELPLGVGDKTVVLRNVKIYDSDAIPPPTISMAISARIYFKGLTSRV